MSVQIFRFKCFRTETAFIILKEDGKLTFQGTALLPSAIHNGTIRAVFFSCVNIEWKRRKCEGKYKCNSAER